jgi:hypothetical protein
MKMQNRKSDRRVAVVEVRAMEVAGGGGLDAPHIRFEAASSLMPNPKR